jgi:hypothetical protein
MRERRKNSKKSKLCSKKNYFLLFSRKLNKKQEFRGERERLIGKTAKS